MNSKSVRVIDLFCGAGGSSYGARNAGAEIVAGFDIWETALEAYQANFPNAKVFPGDIRALSLKKIKEIKSITGNVDLILASPECTNHSKAKGGAERSEESRKTAFEVVKFAKVYRPKWIIIENVIEMQSWHGHIKLIKSLKKLGYAVKEIVLNSTDFGIPQSRERLFIVCYPPQEALNPDFELQMPTSASTIIEPNGRYNFSPLRKEGRAQKTIEAAERAIAELGDKTPFLLVYYGSGRNGNGGWQTVDQPIGTITTLDRFAYVVPGENGHMMRMLQPEELKLAMGFGPDFKLDELEGLTRRNKIKLMGNGVCPPVMEAIVGSLIDND